MSFNIMLQSCPLLTLLFLLLLHTFSIPTCHCQTTASPPQNIETFYPNQTSAPQQPETSPQTQQQPPPPPPPIGGSAPGRGSSGRKIAKAVAATAASTIVFCGLIFFVVQRCLRARKRKREVISNAASGGDNRVVPQGNVFERIDGNVKGLIVDEDGLDVIYWRKLQSKNSNKDLHKEVLSSPRNKEKEDDHDQNQAKKSKSVQEVPLLRGKSSTSHLNVSPEEDEPYRFSPLPSPPSVSASTLPSSAGVVIKGPQKPDSPIQPSTPPPPVSPSTPSSSVSVSAVPEANNPAPAPPPPPIPARRSPAPPPPPPASSKTLPPPIEIPAIKQGNSSGKGIPETSNDQVKLKPLHWDKVNTNNADHSMVWDKVDRGSFR